MSWKDRLSGLSKNQSALAGLIKIIAFVVIAGVVIYCDIQFIQVMSITYPDGIAKIFTLLGAVATGASMLALIGAEAFWFSRGPQMLAGWIFTAVEAAISAANLILSFQINDVGIERLDQSMGAYLWICPATPVVAALFWIVIFNLDEGQKARHDEREMQDDIAAMDRKHRMATHIAKMELRQSYLESTTTKLKEIAKSQVVQAGLEAGAWQLASEELRSLTGIILPLPGQQAPALPNANTVDSTPSPAPVAPPTPDQAPTPSATPEPEKLTRPDPPAKKSDIIVQAGPLDRTIFSPLAAAPNEKSSRNGAS